MLLRRPDISRHVRKLIIRPRRPGMYGFNREDSRLVSRLVKQLASERDAKRPEPKLDALTTFAWEDEELPFYDDMWFALRMGFVDAFAIFGRPSYRFIQVFPTAIRQDVTWSVSSSF